LKLETRNQKLERRREQVILYAPLFIWIGVIFFLSSGQGASTRTSLIIRPILEFLFPTAPEETLQLYHGFIRKCAHLTEYGVLGLLACRAFVNTSGASFRKYFYVLAAVLVLLVASTDELNQSFNPDRTGSPTDVLIDLAGGVCGILVFKLWTRRRARKSALREA
jgi:VanZ family protein